MSRPDTMSNRIGGGVAKSVTFGLAGLGLGGLAARDLLHDYRADTAATLAGSSFMLAFLLLSPWASTRRTQDLLRATGISVVFMISSIAFISGIGHVDHDHNISIAETALIFLCAGLAGNLTLLLPGLRSSFVLGKVSLVVSAAAIASGMAFLEGFVIDPRFAASIMHDSAAMAGALGGALLGVLLASGVVRYPDDSAEWSWIVVGALVIGMVAAKVAGIGTMFVTPVAVFWLKGLNSKRSKRRGQTPDAPTVSQL